jgi:hypothetical protein
MAKMEDGVVRLSDLRLEIYKISEPSGVTLGCRSCSALAIILSAKGWSIACLNISEVPFRFELNKTALLSGVQAKGLFWFSSSVSFLLAGKRVPSGASVPM